MIHIVAMTPERYQGHYANSPPLNALLTGKDPWPIIQEIEMINHSAIIQLTNSRKKLMNASAENINPSIQIRVATDEDRIGIYQSRYNVYAVELEQHLPNPDRLLKNDLDEFNIYIIALIKDTMVGYVSITPPGQARYSLDGYLPRADWPFDVSDSLYEIRLLTVIPEHRGKLIVSALMYAALRYIQARGGTRIMATGRLEAASIYRRIGLRDLGIEIQSGKVTYLLMSALVSEIQEAVDGLATIVARMKKTVEWQMAEAFSPCSQKNLKVKNDT
jgi:ribosomal protein S18 acetylase RimI-like enzyme